MDKSFSSYARARGYCYFADLYDRCEGEGHYISDIKTRKVKGEFVKAVEYALSEEDDGAIVIEFRMIDKEGSEEVDTVDIYHAFNDWYVAPESNKSENEALLERLIDWKKGRDEVVADKEWISEKVEQWFNSQVF